MMQPQPDPPRACGSWHPGVSRVRSRHIADAIQRGDLPSAIETLRNLATERAGDSLPRAFLQDTLEALSTGNWDFFGPAFGRLDFIGRNGEFLLVAPYRIRRQGKVLEELSVLQGTVIQHHPLPPAQTTIHSMFGQLSQPLLQVLPVQVFSSAGLLSSEQGEAFVVPDGWPNLRDGNGPALNNMAEQRRRFTTAGRRCIRAIFDQPSAELLLAPLRERAAAFQLQFEEYQLHDFGHAAGIGLVEKLRHELLATPSLRGVEEWRADGVGFEIGRHLLPAGHAAQLVASNLVTRFGIDAQRHGGLDLDTDAFASLLTFNFLVEAGALTVTGEGKLAFRDASLDGLLRAVEPMRAEALRLTRAELAAADAHAIWRLYGFKPTNALELLFWEKIVNRCSGFYDELR